jgi:hypothetical protein
LGREEGLTVRRRRLIRAGAALVLGAAAVYAQLMPYDEWRKARERREEAEARLEWGLAAAAVFAGGWGFGQLARRRRKLPAGAIAAAFSRPPSVLGARICKALGVAAILLAASVVVSYYASCAKDPGTARIGPPFLTMLGLWWVAQYFLRESRRLSTPLADEAMASDPRPPVVFLRGFAEEEFELGHNRAWFQPQEVWTFEDAALDAFQKLGPLVGLTNPMLRGRPSAYAPLDVASRVWPAEVENLVRRAGAIVVVAADSEGLKWEVALVRDMKVLGRTVFLFPPVSGPEAQLRVDRLAAQLGLPRETVIVRGAEGGQPLALTAGSGGTRLYLGKPDLNGYLDASERAVRELAAASAAI